MPKKQLSYDQVARKKDKAVQFLSDVVGDDDKADDFDDMSVEEYADKKHIQIVNSKSNRVMANGTKQDLQDQIDDLTQENQDLQDQLDAINDILNPPSDGDDDDDDDDDDAGAYDSD